LLKALKSPLACAAAPPGTGGWLLCANSHKGWTEESDPVTNHYLKAGSAFHVELGAAGTLEADASRMARLRSLADAMQTKAEANRGA